MTEWIPVCHVDDVDLEDVHGFQHNGTDYALYRSSHGEFFATGGQCTHEKTLLCDGLVIDGVIECPKHNGRFDYASGKALGAPVIVDLPTYPVKVDGRTVYLGIE